MKTSWLLVCLVCLFCLQIFGQNSNIPFGDEWINEDQQYFKFGVAENGVYRITYEDLIAAKIPAEDINGSAFQIFSLGKEIALRTSTETVFGPGDYIEFYGTHNDGSIDGLLYSDADNQQLNPYISLYDHSRPYFLTWSSESMHVRYIERNNGMGQGSLPPQEPYYVHREILQYDEFHHKPSHDGRNFIRYSSMDYGEGYGSELEKERTIHFKVSRLSSFGINPRLVIRMGTNVFSSDWEISTDTRKLQIATQRGYGIVKIDERFPLEELYEGEFNVHFNTLGDDRARHTLARAELHYPRKYEFDGETQIHFHQQASILSRYIEITGFGGSHPLLYNLTNQSYIIPEQQNDILRFVTSEAFTEQEWVLVDQELAIKRIKGLREVNLSSQAEEANYLIISHDNLINSGAVEEYAEYRSSSLGGGYNVAIYSIENLVDRYAYGIKAHPLGIKNLMKKLEDEDILPEFVYIIGKGREYTDTKEDLVDHPTVPTFGIPGSDNLLVTLDRGRHPAVAIGRLAARTDDDIRNYLEKIKMHENPIDNTQDRNNQFWKKEIMHLSGGSAGNQATLFRFLNKMGDVIAENTFGGSVFTFRKTTADPIERVSANSIMERIDKGVSLLTFFGHSAVGTFDFSLEDPSKYSNTGRNPVILSLGCHSGNIHTPGRGISEDFVLQPDKGAIAFIASSGTAYPQPQFDTGKDFYGLLGGTMYGQPIGQILMKSLEARMDNPSLAVETLIEQLTIHGDPAYRISSFEGPDFIVENARVTSENGVIDATTQSFTLDFTIYNLGSAVDDVLDIRISHFLPDGTIGSEEVLSIPTPANMTDLSIDINNPGNVWSGANRLKITLDNEDLIAEFPNIQAELNNTFIDVDGREGVEFFVFDNSAKPIYPQDFGIHNQETISLRAAINNGLQPDGLFVLQIDTTEYFNSPLFLEATIKSESSSIVWQPEAKLIPGIVYYWRIAPYEEREILKSNSWQSSSFIYLPDSESGWNQSHYFQMARNDYYKMSLPEDSRTFTYDDRIWDVRIKNEIRSTGDFWVYVNNTPWASLNPREMGSLVSVFAWDYQNVIFKNSGNDFGSIPFSTDGFIYDLQDSEDVINLIDLLQSIPDGLRVFFHTMLEDEQADLHMEWWDDPLGPNGESLIDVLEQNGSVKSRDLTNRGTVPYTYIFDKGEGSVVEDIAHHILETIDLSTTARSIWSDGTLTSVPIRTSGKWLHLLWDEEKEDSDYSRLYVLGVRPGGQRDTLKAIGQNYSVSLTNINPDKYPSIQLVYDTQDPIDKSVPQLKYWRVITTALPDAAFEVDKKSFNVSDTLNAGEILNLNFDISNFTDVNMEPILIRYTLIDEDFEEQIIVKRSGKLNARDKIQITEQLNTDKLSGDYQLIIELNPNEDLPELTMCNNLGFINFYVRPDKRNPFLDVTFDGKHISDGEIVSSRPEIVVSLTDRQSYLLLDNPEDFDIVLYYPEVFTWHIDESSSAVEWVPATSKDQNTAAFVIRPNLNVAGIYTLEVQAKDIAGNAAGGQTYRIRFEVDPSADIPKLVVSPNPMTVFADFEYYHDSTKKPDKFELLIYSSDGKLIKVVDQREFGGIRKGFNRYRWHALTDNGEPLTTGVYYYEIVNNLVSRKDKQKGSVLMVR